MIADVSGTVYSVMVKVLQLIWNKRSPGLKIDGKQFSVGQTPHLSGIIVAPIFVLFHLLLFQNRLKKPGSKATVCRRPTKIGANEHVLTN